MRLIKSYFGLHSRQLKIGKCAIDRAEVMKLYNDICRNQILPHAIEPSFGIGRLMYTLLEHNFVTRSESDSRTVTKAFLFIYLFYFDVNM